MGLHIIADRFVEEFGERILSSLPYDVEIELLPRKLVIYTAIPIRRDWIQECIFESLCVTLPETQTGTLQGTLDDTLRGTLFDTLTGTGTYLDFVQKQVVSGRGDRYMIIVYLEKLFALVNQTKKKSYAAYVLHRARQINCRYISVRTIQGLLGFIDTVSMRQAIDIKTELFTQGVIKNNGKVRTYGSEIIAGKY